MKKTKRITETLQLLSTIVYAHDRAGLFDLSKQSITLLVGNLHTIVFTFGSSLKTYRHQM